MDTTRVGLLSGATALALTGVSFAGGPTDAQGYEARIAELEAQVAELSGDNWMTEQRAEEIRSVVTDVLADADTRSSLLQSGMTAGYDDGFMIGSVDGNFSLKLNGHVQARFVWNALPSGSAGGTAPGGGTPAVSDDRYRYGFENTRTQLWMSGNVGGPEFIYTIGGNFERDTGNFTLRDAWVGWDGGEGLKFMMGQFKVPLNREFLVHSSQQLLAERSLVSYLYNGGRTQGFMVDWSNDQWHVMGSFNDGANGGGGNPDGAGQWENADTEWAFTARGELLIAGTWDQFDDFTSPQGSEQGMLVGVGFHYQADEFGTATATAKEKFWILSADFSWEGDGFNLFANVNYADFDTANINPFGFVIQGGFYFTEKIEGFARYEWNDYDQSGANNVDDLSVITLGVNHYYNANVKATLDVGIGLNSIQSAEPFTGAYGLVGLRRDGNGESGQISIRAQLQLLF